MNNRVLIMCIFCVICLLTYTFCGNSSVKNTDKPIQKYVDIYDVVTEAYLTNEG